MQIENALIEPATQVQAAVLAADPAAGRVRVGTSVWMYRHWAHDVFYPRGLKPNQWLEYYCGRFATVELNASFYRLPTPEAIARWSRIAPDRFVFAVKCWRWITHVHKLKTAGTEDMRAFLIRIEPLAEHLGPLLVQLPPAMQADPERLDEFLRPLPKKMGRTAPRIALEVRHESWLTDEVRSLLDRFGACLVLADGQKCPTTETNDAPFVYIRRHGAQQAGGKYSDAEIRADADRIRRFAAQGRDVYVYYNNDWHGYAVANARRLIEILEADPRRSGVVE